MKDTHFTVEPVALTVGRQDIEWASVQAVSARFSLSRSLVYELIQAREIQSVSLRRRGQQKGKRLVFVDSMRDYFARLLEVEEGPVFVVGKKRKGGKSNA